MESNDGIKFEQDGIKWNQMEQGCTRIKKDLNSSWLKTFLTYSTRRFRILASLLKKKRLPCSSWCSDLPNEACRYRNLFEKLLHIPWCVEWKIHRLLNVSLSFGGQCLPGRPSTYDRTRKFHTPWQSWYLCAPNVEQPPLIGASGFSAAFSFWMELKPTKTSEEAAICWPPFASPGRNEQVLIFCNPSQLSYMASLKLPGWVWLWPCLTFNLSFNLLNSSCLVHLSDFRLQLWQGICSLLWIRHKTLTLVKGCAFHWSTSAQITCRRKNIGHLRDPTCNKILWNQQTSLRRHCRVAQLKQGGAIHSPNSAYRLIDQQSTFINIHKHSSTFINCHGLSMSECWTLTMVL